MSRAEKGGGQVRVKQLIEKLQRCSPDYQVILQKDSEGNGYSPLWAVDADCVYVASTTWSGEVYTLSEASAEIGAEDPDGEEAQQLKDAPRVVVLAPVN